ncbi:unannotated protein [freshwater metagenome]|uniref:Unannotated protein n=1 Tax=freshwater metagenome TaxID=449393 RepID=A0A6J6H542_9ZZZZ
MTPPPSGAVPSTTALMPARSRMATARSRTPSRSSPSTRSITMPSIARSASSPERPAAAWRSRSRIRVRSSFTSATRRSTASTSSSVATPMASAAALMRRSSSRRRSMGPVPDTASMRRMFEPIEASLMIFTGPISPSAFTWVPPQSSVECGPASRTFTTSPYLSPKNAIAPLASALSFVVS